VVITTRPYRLDDPGYATLYVHRAKLIPIELMMAGSLALIGTGLLGHNSPLGSMPLVFAFLILGARYLYKPGISERFVRLAQSGGRVAVTRIGLFTDEGFIVKPESEEEGRTKGVVQMPWDRLDRAELDGGYLFLLPFPASPRGVAIPETALAPSDLALLVQFLDEKNLLRGKTEESAPQTAS
jgi:hypothetical protein